MGRLREILINILDPFQILRKHIFHPVSVLIAALYGQFETKAKTGSLKLAEVLVRVMVILYTIFVFVFLATFLYILFYYAYMPSLEHVRPVHMQFKIHDDKHELSTFPSAHVALSQKQQLLMAGQKYRVVVSIDMPESPQNQNLGMFMVCAEMRDEHSRIRGHSCRSTMLRYKSTLLHTIETWILSPFFIFGYKTETQKLDIELFANYEEGQSNSVNDVYVEIQSKHIQFYSVSLLITADFTGLRYLMFNWPIAAAIVGISINLFFMLIVVALSYFHWSKGDWVGEAKQFYSKYKNTKIDQSTSIDEINIPDDDDLSILEEKSSSRSDDIEELSASSITAADDGIWQRKVVQT